jgi:hypothetical protein
MTPATIRVSNGSPPVSLRRRSDFDGDSIANAKTGLNRQPAATTDNFGQGGNRPMGSRVGATWDILGAV